tara:strand:+ start:1035 stop:1547 length:513 start_codon:yes stop_codon:yes gene_type:complete
VRHGDDVLRRQKVGERRGVGDGENIPPQQPGVGNRDIEVAENLLRLRRREAPRFVTFRRRTADGHDRRRQIGALCKAERDRRQAGPALRILGEKKNAARACALLRRRRHGRAPGWPGIVRRVLRHSMGRKKLPSKFAKRAFADLRRPGITRIGCLTIIIYRVSTAIFPLL